MDSDIAIIHQQARQTFEDIDRKVLLELLSDKGAVLLRGFTADLHQLETFTHVLCERFHVVGTRAKRQQPQGDSYSTEVLRDNFALLGHTEGSYRPHPYPPDVCFFLCLTPPDCAGGETLLVDGARFYANLPTDLRQRLQDEGITYEMQWPPERWQSEFGVNTASELRGYLSALPGVRFTLDNENLHLRYTTAAITRSRNGQPVFATGVLAHLPTINHPKHPPATLYANPLNKVYFGHGEELSAAVINRLIDIHDQLAYYHVWQANDLIVIDNTRVLHGRTMTSEPCERIILSRFGQLKPA